MALLNYYDSRNRVIDTGLTITYNKRRIYGDWVHTVGAGQDHYYQAWEMTRYAKKSYRYVGMDYATAQLCAAAMATKYTRTEKDSVWDLNDDAEFAESATGSDILMADIVIQHNDGCMYSVSVSVNETDTRMRRTPPVTVASLFSAENSRDYDTATYTTGE